MFQVCLQPGHLNKTDHWPINIGALDINKSEWVNSSQNLMETDRGKTLVEAEEGKSIKTGHFGETRTESLVEKLDGVGDTLNDVGKDMDVKKGLVPGRDEVNKDLLDNQYRGIGNMVGAINLRISNKNHDFGDVMSNVHNLVSR